MSLSIERSPEERKADLFALSANLLADVIDADEMEQNYTNIPRWMYDARLTPKEVYEHLCAVAGNSYQAYQTICACIMSIDARQIVFGTKRDRDFELWLFDISRYLRHELH